MQAALDLFAQNGFENTTAAQIASRAGVTERTFFRHFPDKKEVLFQGQAILSEALSKAIAAAPVGLAPIDVLHAAFLSVTDVLEQHRAISEPRQRIIATTPALQEREVAKHAALVRDLADALRARSIPISRASLAAQTGLAVLSHALAAWFADPGTRLAEVLDQAFSEFRNLSAVAPG
jgi:AcrR family transcriptional regulator